MRSRVLLLAASASFLLFQIVPGARTDAHAADLGEDAPIEDAAYSYGDDDYVVPSPVYVAVRGATSLPEDVAYQTSTSPIPFDYDTSYWVGAGVGIDLEQAYDIALMRGEIEATVIQQSADDGDTTAIAGFLSLYRDLGEFYHFRPYVGAGVGIGYVSVEAGQTLDDYAARPAFHLTGGIAMEWSERIQVDLGYRYTSILNVEATATDGTTSSEDINSHALFAGLRFRL